MEVSGKASRRGCFIPGKEARYLLGSRGGLDVLENLNVLSTTGIQTPVRRVLSPVQALLADSYEQGLETQNTGVSEPHCRVFPFIRT
jgi:hypothetical protein